MAVLGVAPPYTEADVKQAYLLKAKALHPDRGGNAHEFNALHEAFQRAEQYLEFKRDSRAWIAKHMQGYLDSRDVGDTLRSYGAQVVAATIDWLQRSFGDFAELTESIIRVRLEDSARAEQMIEYMLQHVPALGRMTHLELPGCQLSEESVRRLSAFEQLMHLDLSRVPVSKSVRPVVAALTNLESINLDGTRVGWWSRRRIAAILRKRRAQAALQGVFTGAG